MKNRKLDAVYITGLSLKPHYGFAYSIRYDRNFTKSLLPRKHFHLTEISQKAKRRLVTVMQWMIFLSPMNKTYCKIQKRYFTFKLNFITLTLSGVQSHSDKFIMHKMLRPFLKYIQRKGATSYVWKAETQDNGNLHFHITTNTYIHWRSIRNKWNSLQNRYGYLTKYFETHSDKDANSTDVHSVKNNNGIVSYMVKYMLKSDRYKKNQSKKYNTPDHYYHDKLNEIDDDGKSVKRYIECKLWSCSQKLSKYKINVTEEHEIFNDVMNEVNTNSYAEKMEHGTMYTYADQNLFNRLLKMGILNVSTESVDV